MNATLQYSQVIQYPRPCSFNNSFLTQEIKHQIKNQVQGAVRRDLVKVIDPLLKKAPPCAFEFGSDGPSCHDSTWASAKFTVLSWILRAEIRGLTWRSQRCQNKKSELPCSCPCVFLTITNSFELAVYSARFLACRRSEVIWICLGSCAKHF